MIKGIYNAASGMLVNQERLNITANNLANANTTGFKKDQAVQKSFRDIIISRIEGNKKRVELGSLGNGTVMDSSYTDYTQGSLKETGNKLDLALEGSAFFVIQTPEGIRYTRDGNFALNNRGQIVTQQGYLVLGERGPIQTIDGMSIDVGSDGQLYFEEIRGDRFQIVEIRELQSMGKTGDNLYSVDEDMVENAIDFEIKQGFLEGSNINIVQEMVEMIQLSRNYEATQKVITTMDSTLEKAVNVVGRLG